MKIVLDSDVVIAGLISAKGAGKYILKNFLTDLSAIQIITSAEQIKEIKKAISGKNFIWPIDKKLLEKFCKKSKTIKLEVKIQKKAQKFVIDIYDSHILAIAIQSKARFLLTYNLKDYKREKIKEIFDILVQNPGYFLQYLRQEKPPLVDFVNDLPS